MPYRRALLNEAADDIVETSAALAQLSHPSDGKSHPNGSNTWGRGWACVDRTHIDLAWRPALNPRGLFSYKRWWTLNVASVILPHSLRIIEVVIGFLGSAQDSRVWAGQSRILQKPRLHLNEGEFIWSEGSYGYSPFTVGPFDGESAEKSRNIRRFNYAHSSVKVRVEHAIGYLRNRFQCLKGYRGNLYREEDHLTSSKVIKACIIAYAFVQRYDCPEDTAEYLSGSADAVDDVVEDLLRYRLTEGPYRRTRHAAQRSYEEEVERERRS